MYELYNKIDDLKNELDKLDIFKQLEKSIEDIKDNQELINKINMYNNIKDDKLRLEIYGYDEIIKYKEIENEVNLLILQINQKLNKIKDNRSCCHEGN